MTPAEIRLKCIELAEVTLRGAHRTPEVIIDFATKFENYVAAPAPDTAKTTSPKKTTDTAKA